MSPAAPSLRFHAHRPRMHIELPRAAGASSSVLAFSYNKAGSSMFYRTLESLCQDVGLTFVSIPGTLFRSGVEVRSVDVEVALSPTGHCYGGFRHFPDFDIPLLDTAKATLLVRDPRDALVSHYYSTRDSHPLPRGDSTLRERMLSDRAAARRMSIDQWVIENHGATMRCLEGYLAQRFLKRPTVAVFRYEDVVYRKREWIGELARWYEWEISDRRMDEVAALVDVFPDTPDPRKHIRQVKPGNFRSALKPVTQNRLTSQFRQVLELFGYDTELVRTGPLSGWR